MTGDVLEYGDERPPRPRSRRFVAGVTAAALVFVGGIALARSHGKPATKPEPSPPVVQTIEPSPEDEFAGAVTVTRPAREPGGILGPGGIPAFFLRSDKTLAFYAYEAVGGPPWAPLLVGFCPPLQRFQDQAGTYAYDLDGHALHGEGGLPAHDARIHPGDSRRVDVSPFGGLPAFGPAPGTAPVRRCPVPVTYPPLPPRTDDVHETRGAHRVIQGRFVVTTETLAFCAARLPAGCADSGWETNVPGGGAGTLLPSDLAGSYTYEGDFLVRGNSSDGSLSVIRLPGVRLVRRGAVGVAARTGVPVRTYARNGVTHLFMSLGDGPNQDFAVRADAEIVLGLGVTGLGLPRGTPDTLRRWISEQPEPPQLWLILDTRGRVLRVVVAQPTVVQ